jgi:hypothetical protein
MIRLSARSPHVQRRGWLKHGNPPGDVLTAPRCGARTRRGTSCQGPAMRHRRRCRLHGGLSTGARTPEGLARIRQAVTKHGWFTRAAREERRQLRQLLRESRETLAKVFDEC